MYDLKTLYLYFLLFFGITLLMFPEQIYKLAPDNFYMQKLIEYKQIISVSSILASVYLYLNQTSSKTSTATTISSSLPETTSSRLPTYEESMSS